MNSEDTTKNSNVIVYDNIIYDIEEMDKQCIETFYKGNKAVGSRFRLSWLEKHQYIYNYLKNRYSDYDSMHEVIFRIKNKIDIRPVCKTCGSRLPFLQGVSRFQDHCSIKCMENDPEIRQKTIDTTVERYGVINYSKTKEWKEKVIKTNQEKYGVDFYCQTSDCQDAVTQFCMDNYGVKRYAQTDKWKEDVKTWSMNTYGVEHFSSAPEIVEKRRKTCMERYGVPIAVESEDVKAKIRKTTKEHYGVEHYVESAEFKKQYQENCIKKYGVPYYMMTDEFQEKSKNARLKWNKTIMSNLEEQVYAYLLTLFNNVIFNYKSEKYPFFCDFYIPEKDIYIEVNGTWTHGKHPFNEDNIDDINTLSIWKKRSETSTYFKRAIHIWTESDPKKVKWAKDHNLNYLVFYTYNDVIDYFSKNEK